MSPRFETLCNMWPQVESALSSHSSSYCGLKSYGISRASLHLVHSHQFLHALSFHKWRVSLCWVDTVFSICMIEPIRANVLLQRHHAAVHKWNIFCAFNCVGYKELLSLWLDMTNTSEGGLISSSPLNINVTSSNLLALYTWLTKHNKVPLLLTSWLAHHIHIASRKWMHSIFPLNLFPSHSRLRASFSP